MERTFFGKTHAHCVFSFFFSSSWELTAIFWGLKSGYNYCTKKRSNVFLQKCNKRPIIFTTRLQRNLSRGKKTTVQTQNHEWLGSNSKNICNKSNFVFRFQSHCWSGGCLRWVIFVVSAWVVLQHSAKKCQSSLISQGVFLRPLLYFGLKKVAFIMLFVAFWQIFVSWNNFFKWGFGK